MPRILLLSAIVATLTLTACSNEPLDTHPDQPVTKRKAVFKQMLRTLEPMGMVVREREDYDRQAFLAGAMKLKQLANEPWVHFTPDSNYPPTRAKPEVWQKPADFTLAQQKLKESTDQLVKAAESGNMGQIRPALNSVEESCKSCHQDFRGKV
ncbi:MAG: cytochrome c [Sulfurimicrobium sp.]|nr:cytochrome c [Sulfurimicrobium sp.]MDP2198862.1 cytochrome c [Sulfurimicrobium sp.]MDP2963996.1 cytochrome c [Sulfurimicrobium sp.]MDP3687831.1 cytochrome c [Sulfurimicrobium sp.]MDZ7655254.1 cytochrome c [Sulfurimicrobium sp.]